MTSAQDQVRNLAFLAKQKVRLGQSAVYWACFIRNAHTLIIGGSTNLNPQVIIDYLNGDRYDLFTEDTDV